MNRLRPFLAISALTAFALTASAQLTSEDFRQMQTRFQQSEEDVERLRARVQKLEASVAELRSQLGDVRNTASSAGRDAVSQDQLKKVVEQLRDLDKRRQDDNDKIVLQLKRLADLPAPLPPSEPDKTEKKSSTGKARPEGSRVLRTEVAKGATNAPAGEVKSSLPADYEFYDHTIGEGQTLGEILAEYNKAYGLKVRLKHVLEANPKLNPNRMVVGKKIRIPVVK
jgi:TolA-binding protein